MSSGPPAIQAWVGSHKSIQCNESVECIAMRWPQLVWGLPKLGPYSENRNGLPGRVVFAVASFSKRVRETLLVIAAQLTLRLSNLDDGTSWMRARLVIGAGERQGSKTHEVTVSCIFPWRVE